MYEGVTEYFANLFQINQGLITEEDFTPPFRPNAAHAMNDTMFLLTMSANVLKQPYKDQYINVYQKGSLIGMCLILLEKKQEGILDLQKLANEYGVSKPFSDNELLLKLRF
jgi:predicted metalloprotease with PDZ domain